MMLEDQGEGEMCELCKMSINDLSKLKKRILELEAVIKEICNYTKGIAPEGAHEFATFTKGCQLDSIRELCEKVLTNLKGE